MTAADAGPGKLPRLTASAAVFAPSADAASGTPHNLWLARSSPGADDLKLLSPAQRAWLAAQGFKATSRRTALLPDVAGGLAGAVLGAAPNDTPGAASDPMAVPDALVGLAAQSLPAGLWRLAQAAPDPTLAAIAWGLGAYRDRRYKSAVGEPGPRLVMPEGADERRVYAIVDGVGFGRDLVNMPANDLGPAELEAAARQLAGRHGADVSVITGEALLAGRFNLIHTVGRASTRAPRLIDLAWGRSGPRVTLVGKGICFDTGGLDIKPSSSMLLMKKDMAGAASVLALAHMIMATALEVRLRVLIPAAENAVAGNAFRPGDVLVGRGGRTVEIGNTDAEGRLVLADALALADEEQPDLIATFSTLTGAARTALGPELAPLYCDHDALALRLEAAGRRVCDPLWRLPFWTGYESLLDSPVADMNNVSESPFAGSIIAALFLRRFVAKASKFAHFDIYGWRPAAKPLGPRGGEVPGVRALFDVLSQGLG
jgi:leucyl aminopeptidase